MFLISKILAMPYYDVIHMYIFFDRMKVDMIPYHVSFLILIILPSYDVLFVIFVER